MHNSVVITVLSLATVWCQQSPIITSISQEAVVDVGKNVDLSCSVQYVQGNNVIWVKKNLGLDLIISLGTNIAVNTGRYSLSKDEGSDTYILQIRGVVPSDSGIYECRIQVTPTTPISAHVSLTVRAQPTISDNSTRSIVRTEGEEADLECYASGSPTPQITWHREDNKILPSGGAIHKGNQLSINSIRKEDRGTYYCVADNGVGGGAKRNIRVDVSFKPVITVQRVSVGQALTYDADLLCTVEAYPSPSIEWYKDNKKIVNNQHYRISNFATTDQTTSSTLRVVTIQKNQYGPFICQAENKNGPPVESKINLFEVFVPACPPACDIDTIRGSAIDIKINSITLFLALIGLLLYR